MEQNYLVFLSTISIKLDAIYRNTTMNSKEKEREIKKCVKEVINEHPDFGERTKQDLKDLVEVAPNEKAMFEEFSTYMASHNCYN